MAGYGGKADIEGAFLGMGLTGGSRPEGTDGVSQKTLNSCLKMAIYEAKWVLMLDSLSKSKKCTPNNSILTWLKQGIFYSVDLIDSDSPCFLRTGSHVNPLQPLSLTFCELSHCFLH